MDLPGVEKKDISITIHKNNELVVSAHKQGVYKQEGELVKRMERYSGNVTRTILLPEYSNPEAMEAEYVAGVLRMKIPKTHVAEEESCAKKVDIK
ncbi:HSP20-like chaperone [Ochromonadaceae sp. CCMP2298]|nr:HSP20-like chaperone [Ochromonadaceae sp. CCMP2298]|mmetsp:Transcript_10204/g.22642  ORF Transcript_10204/g.22642 Transcript_10204/m.22642 type:complete len:95 (+) Transcript_10204:271-555(+)